MGLFRFISNIRHPDRGKGWQDTIAYFTGKAEKAVVGKAGRYKYVDYNEYQIKYYVDGKERTGWYIFYPVPDPAPEEIQGKELKIRYNVRKPWIYELIDEI